MQIAVLIPCYNEALTIERVVRDFKSELPMSKIYVYDNNSTDKTAELALSAGAIVRHEAVQGKGNVIRRMFADIDSDIYVLVDGDNTYHVQSVSTMINTLITNKADMVVCRRKESTVQAYRFGHRFGNKMLTLLVSYIFGCKVLDMLSGYRVLSHRFVKTFPAHSGGFEIETELTVYALEMRVNVREIEAPYSARPEGSVSKLRTYRDGFHIFGTIINLVRDQKPFLFFSYIAFLSIVIALGLAAPVIVEYVETGLVTRFPTAFLSLGLCVSGTVAFFSGMILDSVSRGRCEVRRLHFLSVRRFTN